ncbi:MAG TPA: hypothetical protein VLT88_00735, partial [Desulfosarcina sp.]|nr:hypothetical protein [Desulfosarcina sp.]
RVITSIQDPEYEEICRELDLEDTIMPSRTTSSYLADMVEGINTLELYRVLKDTARFFVFIAGQDDAGDVANLDLPDGARAVCYYREDRFHLVGEKSRIRKDDEVIVLTDDGTLKDLEERWQPKKRSRVP